jgi:hypothetical protein
MNYGFLSLCFLLFSSALWLFLLYPSAAHTCILVRQVIKAGMDIRQHGATMPAVKIHMTYQKYIMHICIYIMNVGLFTVVCVSVIHGSLLMNIHMNLTYAYIGVSFIGQEAGI